MYATNTSGERARLSDSLDFYEQAWWSLVPSELTTIAGSSAI
ncbi:hypothetical protein HNR02_006231 [Amycolatopsis endophytica]|uniref:Uncharacterized protein n=1 Tax=Amycolatopsis endophytica TaxID=860233 RepID=A0A853BEH6_9PSEU|nr:hypothetical protein [Amycolatopsis endophytica]